MFRTATCNLDFNYMDHSAEEVYDVVYSSRDGYHKQSRKGCDTFQMKPPGSYVTMSSDSGYVDNDSIRSLIQRFSADLTGGSKSTEPHTTNEIVKKRRNHVKMDVYHLQMTTPTGNKEISVSGQEISEMFSSESIPNNIEQKRPTSMYENCSDRYSVPNSRPRLQTDIPGGEKTFRPRSNAYGSKDIETSLKFLKRNRVK